MSDDQRIAKLELEVRDLRILVDVLTAIITSHPAMPSGEKVDELLKDAKRIN